MSNCMTYCIPTVLKFSKIHKKINGNHQGHVKIQLQRIDSFLLKNVDFFFLLASESSSTLAICE